MATTRSDRIFEIVKKNGSHMKVADIHDVLAKVEGVKSQDLRKSTVPSTVKQDNSSRRQRGRAVRFAIFGDGTAKYGEIGVIDQTRIERSKGGILKDPAEQIPELIEAANRKTKEQLKEAIQKLSWREFESSFMAQVLEGLGFTSVEVTRAVKDGGIDATCRYSRGIVRSEAYVSAKRWKGNVGVNEVNQLKGLAGNADTGIIFTSASFTQKAKEAAEPTQNTRSMVLIDIDLIVDACFSQNIGVEDVPMPTLSNFVGFDSESEG